MRRSCALDNLCSFDDPVAARNGELIHAGWLHSHSAITGRRGSRHSNHSRTKSSVAERK